MEKLKVFVHKNPARIAALVSSVVALVMAAVFPDMPTEAAVAFVLSALGLGEYAQRVENEKTLEALYTEVDAYEDDEEQDLNMDRGNILDEAKRLINNDRQKDYGRPEINHTRIANLWSAFLETDITPAQVAMCMSLVKVARLIESPKHLDSYVDMAAYAAIAGEIETGNKQ